jgi:hypothetical protein
VPSVAIVSGPGYDAAYPYHILAPSFWTHIGISQVPPVLILDNLVRVFWTLPSDTDGVAIKPVLDILDSLLHDISEILESS